MITLCEKKNGNIELDYKKKIVKKYFFKKKLNSNYVEIGYMILNKNISKVIFQTNKTTVSVRKYFFNTILINNNLTLRIFYK